MNTRDAAALIRAAVPVGAGVWADIGAGSGTFTRALVRLLGPGARIYAVDRDERAVAALGRWACGAEADVVVVAADFTRRLELPGLTPPGLDGLLLANALHFAREPAATLRGLARLLRPGGTVVVVEYDGRPPSPWVPYPVPAGRLPAVAAAAGLRDAAVLATRPSAFGGHMYVARAMKD